MAHCFPGSTGSTVEGSPPEDVVVTAAEAGVARAQLDYTGSTVPDSFASIAANVCGANDCLSVAGDVPFVGTSPVVFVWDAAMSVVSPAIAGVASRLAVFAREVAVDAASFGSPGSVMKLDPKIWMVMVCHGSLLPGINRFHGRGFTT